MSIRVSGGVVGLEPAVGRGVVDAVSSARA